MGGPDAEKFSYSRLNFPLYFCKPIDNNESNKWDECMKASSREFSKMCSDPNISHNNLLGCGATTGEYSMWLIRSRHSARSLQTKKNH